MGSPHVWVVWRHVLASRRKTLHEVRLSRRLHYVRDGYATVVGVKASTKGEASATCQGTFQTIPTFTWSGRCRVILPSHRLVSAPPLSHTVILVSLRGQFHTFSKASRYQSSLWDGMMTLYFQTAHAAALPGDFMFFDLPQTFLSKHW